MNKIESIQASIGLTVKGSTSAEGKTAGQMFSATLANALGSTPIVAMALPPVATIQHTQFDLPLNLTAAKIWQQVSIGYFGPSCPLIPVHRAQPFRSIAPTHSGLSCPV